MTLAQKKLYILDVLNIAYSEFKNKTNESLKTDGAIRILDISFRLSNIQRPIDFDELSIIVQGLVESNFIFFKKSNILDATYSITQDGIEELEKLKKQLYTRADMEREAMRIADEIAQQISDSMREPEMPPTPKNASKIFISHASKNDNIITAFTQQILRLALHIPTSEIFDTSAEETRVKGGHDFKYRIRVELKSAKVVILFITKEYKDSEICLNELGATWMLEESVKVIPFILSPVDYSNLGLIHNNTQAFKMDKEEDIMAFVGENKGQGGFISPHYNDAALKKAVKQFLKVVEDYKNADNRTEKEKKFAKKHLKDIENDNAPPINVGPSQANPHVIKESENPFYKINNRTSPYLFQKGKYKLIPDDYTLHFLGYPKFKKATYIQLHESQNNLIGTPVKSILQAEIWSNRDNETGWLIYNKRRHHIVDSHTLTLLLKANKNWQVKPVDGSELIKLKEGDAFDLRGSMA